MRGTHEAAIRFRRICVTTASCGMNRAPMTGRTPVGISLSTWLGASPSPLSSLRHIPLLWFTLCDSAAHQCGDSVFQQRELSSGSASLRTGTVAAVDEIVVVDDASTDDSAAIARERQVTCISLPSNVGPGAARNRGIAATTGSSDRVPRCR